MEALHIQSDIAKHHIHGPAKFFQDFQILWTERMMEVVSALHWYIPFSIILPLVSVYGIGRIVGDGASRTTLLYIISGSAILTVTTDSLSTVAANMRGMRDNGTLLYYASLPISKTAFVMALLLSRLILSLPGMIVAIFAGAAIYHVQFQFSWWIVVLLPLTAFGLSSIGMALGLLNIPRDVLGIVISFTGSIAMLALPIFYPVSAVPPVLQVAGYLFPPSYAASALRYILEGDLSTGFYLDMVVLTFMALFSFVLLNRLLNWRTN